MFIFIYTICLFCACRETKRGVENNIKAYTNF